MSRAPLAINKLRQQHRTSCLHANAGLLICSPLCSRSIRLSFLIRRRIHFNFLPSRRGNLVRNLRDRGWKRIAISSPSITINWDKHRVVEALPPKNSSSSRRKWTAQIRSISPVYIVRNIENIEKYCCNFCRLTRIEIYTQS